MNNRSKNLVLLALSSGSQNSVEVQALANNATRIEQHSEQGNSESRHTNSENQALPAKPDEPTTTTPEQDNTTLENPSNSPSILVGNESKERDDSSNFPIGDFSSTDSGNEYRPGPRTRSSSSSSTSSSSSSSSSSSLSSSSSDSLADNNNSNNESLVHKNNQPAEPITKLRGKQRTRDPTTWKKNVAKRLKNYCVIILKYLSGAMTVIKKSD